MSDYDDPVLHLLRSHKVTYEDIEALCAGFDPAQSEDVMLAFRILTTLQQYLAETEGWLFSVLEQFDFQTDARKFDIDIAILVGERSEFLLREINSWGIEVLKTKVSQLQEIYSDAGTVLTILVLRIISKHSDLEFKLQLAVSRSTLVKIHSELGGLLEDVSDNSTLNPLSSKYNAFVTQLLTELETTPYEEVQQEMFQVVRDLHSMFMKWAAKHKTDEQDFYKGPEDIFEGPVDPPPPMENSWLSEHFASSPQPAPPASPTISEDMSSAPWASSSSSIHNYKRPQAAASSSHRRTVSGASSIFSGTSSKASSITDELPSIMRAFDNARAGSTKGAPSLSPSTSTSSVSLLSSSNSNTRLMPGAHIPHSSPSIYSMHHHHHHHHHQQGNHTAYKPASLELVREEPASTAPTMKTSSMSTALTHSRPSASPSNTPQNNDTLHVKMIGSRMMVEVGNSYVDMQDWLNRQNNSGVQQQLQSIGGVAATALSAPTPRPLQPSQQQNSNQTLFKKPQVPLSASIALHKSDKKWLHEAEHQFEQNYVNTMDNF